MDYVTSLLRLLHIGAAILWVGGVAIFTLFVAPAARQAGPAGAQVMSALLLRTKYPLFMPAMAIVTTLAGLALYAQLGYFRAPMGVASIAMLNVGVAAGLLAFLHGLGAITPVSRKMVKLAGAMAGQQGPPSPEQAQEMQRLAGKLGRLSIVFVAISAVAVVGMTTFRYL